MQIGRLSEEGKFILKQFEFEISNKFHVFLCFDQKVRNFIDNLEKIEAFLSDGMYQSSTKVYYYYFLTVPIKLIQLKLK